MSQHRAMEQTRIYCKSSERSRDEVQQMVQSYMDEAKEVSAPRQFYDRFRAPEYAFSYTSNPMVNMVLDLREISPDLVHFLHYHCDEGIGLVVDSGNPFRYSGEGPRAPTHRQPLGMGDVSTEVVINILEQIDKLRLEILSLRSDLNRVLDQQVIISNILETIKIKDMTSDRVFTSHSRRDKHLAVVVAKSLRPVGLSVWVDVLDVQDSNEIAIYSAIRNCRNFLCIWTENYRESEWCLKELGYVEGLRGSNGVTMLRRSGMHHKQFKGSSSDDLLLAINEVIKIFIGPGKQIDQLHLSMWQAAIRDVDLNLDSINKFLSM